MRTKQDRPAQKSRGVFNIAGVPFIISGIPAQGLKVSNPLYRRFVLGDRADSSGPAITVSVRRSSPPVLEGMRRIFDTRESWALFADGKRLWAVYQPPGHAKPFWVAGFDRRAGRIDYFDMTPGEHSHPVSYPLDQLLLMYFLARRQGILTHAAGIAAGGKAFIFPGVSGAGKSTFSELLVQSRVGKLLSDERMIVRRTGGEIRAFGTPWAGTAGIARSGSAPLAGIFFLVHGKANGIVELGSASALDRLLPLASIPWYDHETMTPIIAFAKRLLAEVPAYEMNFTPDRSATDFFLKFIKNASLLK